jgi:hypothetical protein
MPRPSAGSGSAVEGSHASRVIERDLGKLKGELRQLPWSADHREIYLQTAEPQSGNDKLHHKQVVAGVKDALLPAWTTDGARVAYVKKTGRKQYALVWCNVTR